MRLIDPRTGIEVLDRAECMRLLATQPVGRLAVADEGHPVIFPVNYVLHDDHIVFRTAPGTKLDAAARRGPAAFEIDQTDPVYQIGWSVVVTGTVEAATDAALVEQLAALPLRSWSPHEKSNWARIRVDRVSGRRIVAVAPAEPGDASAQNA
jgi:nitroimidazol reductase NimA-like FMN-containing flavoprotein (pyridoxamine 5'-phosphate oxidase superfamily)